LSNTNESATVLISQNILELNNALAYPSSTSRPSQFVVRGDDMQICRMYSKSTSQVPRVRMEIVLYARFFSNII
jgi:hypothetical protein